jgi:hypothetical protein
VKKLTLQQLSDIAYPGTNIYPPPQEELEAKALYFLRTNRPKVYKKLEQSGELEEYCQLKAQAAKRYAENLIQSGEWLNQAWNRAIRLEILESETD